MKTDDATRLKDLVKENVRLMRIVTDQALDLDAMREVARGCFAPVARTRLLVRRDNVPALTAQALADWCWCKTSGSGTHYIDRGSPRQNAWT